MGKCADGHGKECFPVCSSALSDAEKSKDDVAVGLLLLRNKFSNYFKPW